MGPVRTAKYGLICAISASMAGRSAVLGSAGAEKRRDIDSSALSGYTVPVRSMRRRECPGSRIAARLAFQLAAVASEVRSPMTVAGPRRIRTGFLHRHRLTRALSHSRGVAVRN